MEERRKNADIVYIHQLSVGSFNAPDLLALINVNNNRRSSRTSNNFYYLPFCTSNYSMFSPLNRNVPLPMRAVVLILICLNVP